MKRKQNLGIRVDTSLITKLRHYAFDNYEPVSYEDNSLDKPRFYGNVFLGKEVAPYVHSNPRKRYKLIGTLLDIYELLILDGVSIKYDFKVFKEVCVLFNNMIVKAAIEGGVIFKMPYGMGHFQAYKKRKKTHTKRIDWQKYRQTGEIIPLLNPSTDDYTIGYYWDATTILSSYRNYIKYTSLRISNRLLAKEILENNGHDYYQEPISTKRNIAYYDKQEKKVKIELKRAKKRKQRENDILDDSRKINFN